MAQTQAAHLDEIHDRLAANRRVAEELTAGLRDDQLLWRPEPERWGIADCLEHLLASDRQYLPKLDRAIEQMRPRPAGDRSATYDPSWFVRWFIRSAGPDGGLKLPAPKVFRPPATARPDAPERFLALEDDLAEAARRVSGLDLESAKITSPVTSLLKLTVGEAFDLVTAHQTRHLNQARAVRGEPRFPS